MTENVATPSMPYRHTTSATKEPAALGFLKSLVHSLGRRYMTEICRREWQQQKPFRINERPVEFSFALRELNNFPIIRILDVGSGVSCFPATLAHCGYLVTAIDNVRDYWPRGMYNRHFHVLDDDIRHPRRIDQKFDALTCISVLEHIAEFRDAARGLGSLLKPGGYLILTCPYNEHRYCADVYREAGAAYGKENPYICQSYSRQELDAIVDGIGGRILKQEYWRVFSGEIWAFGQRLDRVQESTKDEPHQLTCLVIQKS